MAVSAKTLGWVGIGLSWSGSMKGSDLWVVKGTSTGFTVTDSWTEDFVTPTADGSQDISLLQFSRSNVATSFVIERQLDSCDDQRDIDIRNSTYFLMYATSSDDSDAFYKHGDVRGSLPINLLNPQVFPQPPTSLPSFTLKFSNYTVPSDVETHYVCLNFQVPINVTAQKFHGVYIQPIVTSPLVHHMIIFTCRGKVLPLDKGPQGCGMMACPEFLTIWAVGGPDLELPQQAGLPLDTAYVVLQIHYDNPKLLSGVRDSSGFKIFYTPSLRPNDVGLLMLGVLPFSIPPGKESHELTADCPEACTANYPGPLTVLSNGLHMHQLGKSIWTQIIRNGTELPRLGSVPAYDFNHQNLFPTTDESYNTILPGDRLITHCVWNTLSRTNATTFGEETINEMCFNFVFYYPKMPTNDYCVQSGGVSVCGLQSVQSSLKAVKSNSSPSYTPLTFANCSAPSQTNQTLLIAKSTYAPTTTSNSSTSLAVFIMWLCISQLVILMMLM